RAPLSGRHNLGNHLSVTLRTVRPPPRPPLFPYTTLFRSVAPSKDGAQLTSRRKALHDIPEDSDVFYMLMNHGTASTVVVTAKNRSEEHTSELQSRSDLVCRLLLEKKKKKQLCWLLYLQFS